MVCSSEFAQDITHQFFVESCVRWLVRIVPSLFRVSSRTVLVVSAISRDVPCSLTTRRRASCLLAADVVVRSG